MKKCERIIAIAIAGVLMPQMMFAQSGGFAGEIKSLQQVLEQLYTDMLPLCSKLIGVGRGIAGFAATWYIASRVWRHIANAEPIDFYPLFRPFVLGFAVIIFPSVIAMINGVMQPTVTGTAAMVEDSDKAIEVLLAGEGGSHQENGCMADVCRRERKRRPGKVVPVYPWRRDN